MKQHYEKTILFALDTNSASRAVFKEVLVLATSMRAKLVAVSVTPEYEGNMPRVFLNDSERSLNEPFQQVLEEAADYAASLGLHLQTIHRKGKPAVEIAEVAMGTGANLIVLGCSSHYLIERILSGRITTEIIQNAPCDILLVPKNAEINFSRLLVGLKDTIAGREAGKRALGVALSYGSQVHALHAIDLPAEKSLRYSELKAAEKRVWAMLNDFRREAESLEVLVRVAVKKDSVDRGLVDYAKAFNISMIVVGEVPGAGMLDTLRSNVVERVSAIAPCPVLVVKPVLDSVHARGEAEHCFG